MTDQLQICNWLVNHPDILRLAVQMLEMKDNRTLALGQLTPTLSSSTSDNVSI